MTTIQKDEYVFSVDVEKTKEYYKTHTLCDCVCCRNYYAQIKDKLPKLNAFLSEFGVDISKPDEAMSAEMDDYIDYIQVDYTVCGSIGSMSEYELDIYDDLFLSIVITNGFVSPNEQTGEYFTISVMQIELPWVLDEPFPRGLDEPFSKKTKSKAFTNFVRALGALIFVPLGTLCVLAGLELDNIWYVSDLINIALVFANAPIILYGGKYVYRALKDYVDNDGKRFVAKNIGVESDIWKDE